MHISEGPFKDSLQTELHGHGNFNAAFTDDCHLGRLLPRLEDSLGGDLAGVGASHVDVQILQHDCTLVRSRNLQNIEIAKLFSKVAHYVADKRPMLENLSQQHAGLQHGVFQPRQEVARPKARFKPSLPPKRVYGRPIKWPVPSTVVPKVI